MPVLKHAKKKLRQDKKRTIHNRKLKEQYKSLIKKAKLNLSVDNVKRAVSAIDKAAKKHLIHKNKAARLKSSLAKLASGKTPKKEAVKSAVKKAPIKPKPAKPTKAASAAKAVKKPSTPSTN